MRNRRLKPVPTYEFTIFGIESANVRQPSLVDDFYYRESTCSITGKPVTQVSHPLYMLFNQERLDRLGPTAVQQWLRSLESSGNNSVQQILSKCSDSDILSMVKSRHIQHPCELERYLNSLNERADLFNSEVAKIVAERQVEEADKQENVVDNQET